MLPLSSCSTASTSAAVIVAFRRPQFGSLSSNLTIAYCRSHCRCSQMIISIFSTRNLTSRTSPVSSSADLYKYIHDHLPVISDIATADSLISHFRPNERAILLRSLENRVRVDRERRSWESTSPAHPSVRQLKKLFIINSLPFIGFGILDNMIMILAGEYIDQSLGSMLCISTMAAAALGNIISDVAGVGLAHYVESLVSAMGIKHPVLSSEQLESRHARLTVNTARAFGLTIGCLIGMFPLLFFSSPSPSPALVSVPSADGDGKSN